ncbi:MAG TPA: CHRD domain-containing protein [Ktedonobacteraceae bacterium]|jgi:hypothetical protein
MPNIGRQTSKRAIGLALVLGAVLVVLGYSTISNSPSANAVAPLQTQVGVQPPAAIKPSQTDLKHAPTGTADLTWNAKLQALTVTINMSGLAPGSTHLADIGQGSCALPGTVVVASLTPVVAKASPSQATNPPTPPASGKKGGGGSEASSKTTITPTTTPQIKTGIPKSGWFIDVHNGPTLAVDKTSIACGDISNFNTSAITNQFVNLTLGPTIDPNQAANGVAILSIANGQLTVTITMSGLALGSTHQAHIHQGSCRAQGPVLYPLNPVVTKNGVGTSTTIIPKVTSIAKGWYINVHLAATAAELSTQTGFDPLVCGDVSTSASPEGTPSAS